MLSCASCRCTLASDAHTHVLFYVVPLALHVQKNRFLANPKEYFAKIIHFLFNYSIFNNCTAILFRSELFYMVPFCTARSKEQISGQSQRIIFSAKIIQLTIAFAKKFCLTSRFVDKFNNIYVDFLMIQN